MKSNHISQTTTPLPNSKICGPPNCGPFRDIDKERLVPRHRGRINVKALHSGPALQYHFYVLLSLPWYQLFLLMAFSYIIFNFIADLPSNITSTSSSHFRGTSSS